MPIKKSAKKYMRITVRKTKKNQRIKSLFRGAIKNTLEAVRAGDLEKAREWQKKAIVALDKAVQKKIIHKNTAARKKSRLNAAIKKAVKK